MKLNPEISKKSCPYLEFALWNYMAYIQIYAIKFHQTLYSSVHKTPHSSGYFNYIIIVVFSLDSQLVAFTSGNYIVQLQKTVTSSCYSILKGYFKYITEIVFLLDSQLVASISSNYIVQLQETAIGFYYSILPAVLVQ